MDNKINLKPTQGQCLEERLNPPLRDSELSLTLYLVDLKLLQASLDKGERKPQLSGHNQLNLVEYLEQAQPLVDSQEEVCLEQDLLNKINHYSEEPQINQLNQPLVNLPSVKWVHLKSLHLLTRS